MRRSTYKSEDLVQTTLNEILLFLLFFALILLGSQAYLGHVPLEVSSGIGETSTGGSAEEVSSEPSEPVQEAPDEQANTDEIEQLRLIVTGLEKLNEDLEDQLAILGRRIQNTEDQTKAKDNIIVVLNGKITTFDKELKLSEAKNNEQLNELEHLTIIIGNLQGEISSLRDNLDKAHSDRDEEANKSAGLEILIGQLRNEIAEQKQETNWPPYIELTDNEGYRFARNSAIISREFARLFLEKELGKLETLLRENQDQISAIEVIGHTDQESVGERRRSNLDAELLGVLHGESVIGNLVPQDNAGLGLARAVSVAEFLRIRSKVAREFHILPYSAGQLITNAGQITKSGDTKLQEPARRRVEIRLRGKAKELD
ncbi:MAG: hypothetical protein AAF478_05485 [Pseudomonadota bacterium]